jgi:hypothetical protein
MVVLALYAALIMYKCRQTDFVLPFQDTGRLHPQHIDMMGYFAHPLFLRIVATGEETFTELLQLVTREFFAAHRHTDCGKLLGLIPHLLSGGLFQWFSNKEVDSAKVLRGDTLEATGALSISEELLVDDCDRRSVELVESDIMISLQETARGMEGFVMYRTDLFTSRTIDRILEELLGLAEYVSERPRARLCSFTTWALTRHGASP